MLYFAWLSCERYKSSSTTDTSAGQSPCHSIPLLFSHLFWVEQPTFSQQTAATAAAESASSTVPCARGPDPLELSRMSPAPGIDVDMTGSRASSPPVVVDSRASSPELCGSFPQPRLVVSMDAPEDDMLEPGEIPFESPDASAPVAPPVVLTPSAPSMPSVRGVSKAAAPPPRPAVSLPFRPPSLTPGPSRPRASHAGPSRQQGPSLGQLRAQKPRVRAPTVSPSSHHSSSPSSSSSSGPLNIPRQDAS